ncbi:DNA-binding transcriptional regulator [Chroococcidiopsis sp. TS-821]|uniref:helix-turn-helix domain-containing protein n=1 Tax=Chroococcidiopsis sp. TS-821 TaxID=1378066 RepID=UPI000CEF2996|nr:helix-turn-helix transcriptional regulator [Chroococcidiopsis sp. TS-821]PPS41943.1 transcriptional regulator [Chroococcidiopsis sp. TS-821]
MNKSKLLVIDQPLLGKFIRELRQEIKLTQEQFAAHLGITCSSVNRWENGRGKPSPLAMQKVEEIIKQMSASSDAKLRDRAQELLTKYSIH